MESFHITVLTVATIIFIIALTTIGVMMQKGSKVGTFPPFASNCPDGWTETSMIDSVTGVATYTCTPPTPTPPAIALVLKSSDGLTGTTSVTYNESTTSICAKKKWTSANNVVWDGVSNYNGC